MKKLKGKILNSITLIMIAAAFTSAMTFDNLTKEAVAMFIGSLLWLTMVAIEAEKKEGAEV